MKKKSTTNLFFLLCTLAVFSQTIVSTSVEDRKTVLEEFTGIHCVFCPEGHVIAQNIQNNNPDDTFLINIHVGSFSVPGNGEPDFRTQWGTQIANQSGLVGYPAGTVNRQNFPGQEQGNSGTTAMSRNQWTSAANQVMADASYVNVGVEADINVPSNTIEIHVEAYYTGTSPEGTNSLNVALLQNNTLGPQTGGNMGNEYVHQHRLIEMITGQWGINIPTTTAGTFVDETFSYPIPVDHNGIPIEIIDLEVVAFISETHQKIPSGSGAYPTFSGITGNDVNLRALNNINLECQTSITPQVDIQNLGQNDITNLAIEYIINSGDTQTYNWSGSISSLHSELIDLPEITDLNFDSSNTINVSIPTDDNNSNNSINSNFDALYDHANSLHLFIETDSNGDECTWEIRTLSGSLLTSGGPYEDNSINERNINLSFGCYTFIIYDSNGNGGNIVSLKDSENVTIYVTDGNYDDEESTDFATNHEFLGVNDNELQNVIIYPNPASSLLTIKNAENANIKIYDILGKLILTRPNISLQEEIEVSKLQSGNYFIKIEKDNEVATKKFIVIK